MLWLEKKFKGHCNGLKIVTLTIHVHQEPQMGASLGNRAFADGISSNEDVWRTEARLEGDSRKPRTPRSARGRPQVRSREGSWPTAFGGNADLPAPGFRLLIARVWGNKLLWLHASHGVCRYSLRQPWETNIIIVHYTILYTMHYAILYYIILYYIILYYIAWVGGSHFLSLLAEA